MSIRCLCIDDEPLARQGIRLALRPFPDFELVGEYGAGEELIKNFPADIDVLFVDVEMPRLSGFELLALLPQPLPLVVFVTAYDHYAIKAFEAQALDYLLKPIEEARFARVIDRIRSQLSREKKTGNNSELLNTIANLRRQLKKDQASISVKTDQGYFRVKLAELLYIESVGDHVCLHLADQQLITRNTLKFYVTELSGQGFYQIHKSTLVNAKQVCRVEKLRFGDYRVEMSNQALLRVSRRYKEVLDTFLS